MGGVQGAKQERCTRSREAEGDGSQALSPTLAHQQVHSSLSAGNVCAKHLQPCSHKMVQHDSTIHHMSYGDAAVHSIPDTEACILCLLHAHFLNFMHARFASCAHTS
eukprot:1158767-Pelagomonas_calceolata.AAC.3